MRCFIRRKEGKDGYLVENIGFGCEEARAGKGVHEESCDVCEGTGNHRVRNSGRGVSGDRHSCNRGLQAALAGALERYRRGDQQSVKGQSTVEFAVVTAGFIAVSVALSALWHALGDGLLVNHASVQSPVFLADIFLH